MPYQDIQPAPRFGGLPFPLNVSHQGGAYQDPLSAALNFPGMPVPNTNPNMHPQPPYQHSQATRNMWDRFRNMPWPRGPAVLPGPALQESPPPLQPQFNDPNNRAMPAGSMQSPFPGPGGNQPMARPSGRPKLPDPPQPPKQQQGTPPRRGPFGQPFGERQY